jgi:predicted nuclease of predicted toxin-antitoxin system
VTFWIDANLDPDLAAWLGARFKVIAKPLREIGLREADDDALIAAARRFGNIVIVTKDSDFGSFAKRFGAPPQVVWLRCGNISTPEMQAWLAGTFAEALRRIMLGEACVEIPYP